MRVSLIASYIAIGSGDFLNVAMISYVKLKLTRFLRRIVDGSMRDVSETLVALWQVPPKRPDTLVGKTVRTTPLTTLTRRNRTETNYIGETPWDLRLWIGLTNLVDSLLGVRSPTTPPYLGTIQSQIWSWDWE